MPSNAFLRIIKRHYGDTANRRTPQDIENEKYLIPGLIKYNRWFMVPAGFLVQFCAGAVYAWSVFNEPVENAIYGRVNNVAASTFYVAIGSLGLMTAFYGPLLMRFGPRRAALLGATLLYMGYLLAALAVFLKQLWLVIVGYGVVGGMGMGLAYMSPIAALGQWLPDRTGLAGGLSVIGFGSGAIGASPFQLFLIEKFGVQWTFLIQGTLYFVIMSLCAMVLRFPPPNYFVNGVNSNGERVDEFGKVIHSTAPSLSSRRGSLSSINTTSTDVSHTRAPPSVVDDSHPVHAPLPVHSVSHLPSHFTGVQSHLPQLRMNREEHVTIAHDEKSVQQPKTPYFHDNASVTTMADSTKGEQHHIEINEEFRTTRMALLGTLIESIMTREYILLYLIFLFNTLPGVVIVSRLAATVQNVYSAPKSIGALVVSINSVFGVLSRLFFGFISDKLGRKTCYLITILSQTVLLVGIYFILDAGNMWLFIASIWALSVTYSATFALIPPTLGSLFGGINVSGCHGIALTAWAFSAVGGGVIDNLVFAYLVPSHYLKSNPRVYQITIMWVFFFSLVGCILTINFRPTPRDRLFPDKPNQLLRVRLFGRIFRVFSKRSDDGYLVEWVAKDKEEREWRQYLAKNHLVDEEDL